MRAMYPKSPAKRRWGMHRANILPPRGAFAVRSPSNHARRTNLAALRWPCPCAGAPARATASQDRLSTAWPLRRDACPSAPPMPATCQYPPPANACRLPCPLQPETSRRRASAAVIRLMACSPAKPRGAADRIISTGRPTTECCAEPGLDSKTVSKWAQNRRRGPQARPGLRQRCQKRPSKGRVPLGGTIGTPKNSYQSCFLGLPLAEFAPVAVSPTVPQLRQEFSQHKRHAGFLGLPFDQFAPVVLTVVPVGFTAPMPRRAFLGCISPVRARAVRDLLVLLRLLKLPVLRLATRIEMMTQSIA